MTHFHTCTGCQHKSPDCEYLQPIKAGIAALHISSVKHRCPFHKPLYHPGEAVEVFVFPDYGTPDADFEDRSPRCWYPAHIISQKGTAVCAIIREGAMNTDEGEYGFDSMNGSGFVKVPFGRVRKSTTGAADIDPTTCSHCSRIAAVQGCGYDAEQPPMRERSSFCMVGLGAVQLGVGGRG